MKEHSPVEGITQDEKLMALFCHIFGIIAAPILYFTMKDSNYVRFNALQSAIFHWTSFALILFFLFSPVIVIQFYDNPVMGCFVFLFLNAGFIIAAGSIVYSIILGVTAFQGKIKLYPVIGSWSYEKVYLKPYNVPPKTYSYTPPSKKEKGKGLI